MDTNSENFVKITQGIRPCGAFIFHILVKYEQKFQFLGSNTLVALPIGVKFGMVEGTFGPLLPAKFHPIGAMCRPCVAKNLKFGL